MRGAIRCGPLPGDGFNRIVARSLSRPDAKTARKPLPATAPRVGWALEAAMPWLHKLPRALRSSPQAGLGRFRASRAWGGVKRRNGCAARAGGRRACAAGGVSRTGGRGRGAWRRARAADPCGGRARQRAVGVAIRCAGQAVVLLPGYASLTDESRRDLRQRNTERARRAANKQFSGRVRTRRK